MKIDLHVHCSERSRCGKNTETEQVEAAIAAGLDAMVFTDHATLAPQANLIRLNALYTPFRIFGGIELNIEGEDWVVVGLQDDRLMNERWTYFRLHEHVKQAGGFLFLAHPFRYHDGIGPELAGHLPDAIELRSCNTPLAAAARIREVATRLDLQLLCNSDSHNINSFGRYYNIVEAEPEDDAGLVAALRKRFAIVPDWTPDEQESPP
jgi:predicted metal-dependent phosphoesterase TrpH